MPDRNATNTPSLNPYLYCAANPIRNIDPTGNVVCIADAKSQELFAQVFSKEEQQFIKFDSNGYLDQYLINKCGSDSYLFSCLKQLDTDEIVFSYESIDSYQYVDNQGAQRTKEFGRIDFEGEEFMDLEFTGAGNTTGETGFMGRVVFPGTGITGQNSLDDDIHAYTNDKLSVLGTLELIAHEVFGHCCIYVITKDRTKSGHQPYLQTDLNKPLISAITRARREVVNNFHNNNK